MGKLTPLHSDNTIPKGEKGAKRLKKQGGDWGNLPSFPLPTPLFSLHVLSLELLHLKEKNNSQLTMAVLFCR